jgi:hypothetical protein
MIGFTSIPARSRGIRRLGAASAALVGAWMGFGAPGVAPTGRAITQGGG